MLEFRIEKPEDAADGAPVVVLLHGRGADASDLAGLKRWLPTDTTLVLPRAPFNGAQWGYGPGWAWYRYEGEDRPEVESFRESQAELEAFMDALPAHVGFAPGPVVLGGFSQGGTMSMAYSIRNPGAVAAVLNFSGFLADHPDVDVTAADQAAPIFWGHGTMDPAIPFAMAENGRAALREAGASLETRDYPMGHGISPEEIVHAVAWMQSRVH